MDLLELLGEYTEESYGSCNSAFALAASDYVQLMGYPLGHQLQGSQSDGRLLIVRRYFSLC